MKQVTITKEGSSTVVTVVKNGITKVMSYNQVEDITVIPGTDKIVIYDTERINPTLRFEFSEVVNKLGATNVTEYLAALGGISAFSAESTGLTLGKAWRAKVKVGNYLTSGTLVVGKNYNVDNLVAGDDFSNVGYVSVGVSFVATGTTPTVWTNGSGVQEEDAVVKEVSNTMGGVVEYKIINGNTRHIIITTGDFVDLNKIIVYPIGGSSVLSLINANTLQVTNLPDNNEQPLVLEVYV